MPSDRLTVECIELSHPTLAGALRDASKLADTLADDLSVWDVTVSRSDEGGVWLVAIYRRASEAGGSDA